MDLHGHAAWAWLCSMDIDIKHGNGHAVWTWTCRMNTDLDIQHGHGHAEWTLTWSMDMYIQNGHGNAAWTWKCNMDMDIQLVLGHGHRLQYCWTGSKAVIIARKFVSKCIDREIQAFRVITKARNYRSRRNYRIGSTTLYSGIKCISKSLATASLPHGQVPLAMLVQVSKGQSMVPTRCNQLVPCLSWYCLIWR
jgi:hypothetical protein